MKPTYTVTTFGGVEYSSRDDMIAGAVNTWLYGGANTDAGVASYLSTRSSHEVACIMAYSGWLGKIHESDDSVCHADMVRAIESARLIR